MRGTMGASPGHVTFGNHAFQAHPGIHDDLRGWNDHRLVGPPGKGQFSQARFPAGAVIFPNERGTARGFGCAVDGKWVVAMPGVPDEMRCMFVDRVLPFLMEKFAPGGHVRVATVHLFPASEADVDERLADVTAKGRNPLGPRDVPRAPVATPASLPQRQMRLEADLARVARDRAAQSRLRA